MKKQTFLLLLTFLGLNLATSCKKDEAPASNLAIKLALMVDNQALTLNTLRYNNDLGTPYQIEKFAFYLSNLKLKNTKTGASYTVPKSYHLVRAENSNIFTINISNVAAGEYDVLEYAIGVDAKQNTSLDQIGDLDPANGMAWDWNTGYKFIVLEGRYFMPNSATRGLVFHIGENANYKVYQLSLSNTNTQNLQIKTGEINSLSLNVNVAALFRSPNSIDFNKTNQVMGEEDAVKIRENSAKMISLAGK